MFTNRQAKRFRQYRAVGQNSGSYEQLPQINAAGNQIMSGGGHRKDGVVTIYSETIQILIVEQRHRCADQHYGDCLPCGVQRTHGCCGKRGTCGSGRASRSDGTVIPVGQIGLGGVQHWNAGEADKLLCAVVHVEITRYRLV